MSNRDELLSAYLDGELSPDEQRDVERRLQDSSNDRELLEELTEASQAIRLLPRPYAPPELRMEVLEQIDRSHTAVAMRSLVHPGRLKRAAGLGTVIAAGLLVMVATWSVMKVGRNIPNAELARNEPSMGGPMLRSQETAPLPLKLAASKSDAPQPVQVVGLSKDEIRQKISELDHHPIPGNAIQVPGSLRTENGETPIVVVFTVVDVMHAMNQMQVLVRKQHVRTLDNRIVDLDQKQSPDSQLTAVTLELAMDGPDMAAVLNSISALDAVMYVEDGPRQKALLVDGFQQKNTGSAQAASASRENGSAVPRESRNDVESAAEGEMAAASDQPTQFDFRQLADSAGPIPSAPPVPAQAVDKAPENATGQHEQKPAMAANDPLLKDASSGTGTRGEARPVAPAVAAAASPFQEKTARKAMDAPDSMDWDRARKFRAIILLKQQHSPEKVRVAPESD
jgi:hypothetical protein